MTPTPTEPTPRIWYQPPRATFGLWLALGLGVLWVILERIPLLLNAEAHLDSDLAVDGLTLIEALNGRWRWHYPGTPHMGSIPVLLSYLQARIWGANPITLASGGVVAYVLVVVSTFWLTLRAYGSRAAAWGIFPLAFFASTGTVWLSGRITGGHLLTVAWHALAFAGLYASLTRGGFARVAALGLWCGLGLYLDRMFALSLASLVAVGIGAWLPTGRALRGLGLGVVFLAGVVVGELPHRVGVRIDPNDSYPEQFAFDPWDARFRQDLRDLTAGHARILLLDCLPRLFAGHRLPGLESEPAPQSLARPTVDRGPSASGPIAWSLTMVTLPIVALAFLAVTRDGIFGGGPDREGPEGRARRAVGRGLIMTSALVVGGFILNKNIFNSDNYRYLVFLLVPWSVGFGLICDRLMDLGRWRLATLGLIVAIGAPTTIDLAIWYHRFGWIDDRGLPVRRSRPDPTLAWLREHPEVREIFGGYWDVYRISFLTGGRVRGVPYPIFPDRFPEWSRDLPGHRPRIVLARPSREGEYYRASAMAGGGRVLRSDPSALILDWP